MRAISFIAAVTFMYMVSHSAQAPSVPQPDSVFLEDLTWMEVREALARGKTTVIIPTGGTEQTGPTSPLGSPTPVKYKTARSQDVRECARRASVAYVPEATSTHRPGTCVCRDDHVAPGRLQQSP